MFMVHQHARAFNLATISGYLSLASNCTNLPGRLVCPLVPKCYCSMNTWLIDIEPERAGVVGGE